VWTFDITIDVFHILGDYPHGELLLTVGTDELESESWRYGYLELPRKCIERLPSQ
jgi:hypothetical protein